MTRSLVQKITVSCYSGYQLNEKPREVVINNKILKVEKILDSEYVLDNQTGNKIKKFKIQASDNNIYRIWLDNKTQNWYLDQ